MKTALATFFTCLALTVSSHAKQRKTVTKTHSTVPTTSKMIVLPPVPAVPDSAGKPGLITTSLNGKDVEFFNDALSSGRTQIFLGELVSEKGEDTQIKAVGKALASTQTEENTQIARLAQLKGVKVSTEPSSTEPKLEAELAKLEGSHFDKACMDKIIVASEQSLAAYQEASTSADGDIKAFSEQMLPIAKEKLRLAQKMTGVGAKAASQLFRTGAPQKAPAGVTVH